MTAGLLGGLADALIMRFADALLAFPGLVLAIALAAALGPGLGNAMLAVAITLAPQFARLARAQALSISTRPFVEAAVAAGTPPAKILSRHVLPNGIGALLVQASLAVGSAILQTAALGFLGLGAQPPLPEWGRMSRRACHWCATRPGWPWHRVARSCWRRCRSTCWGTRSPTGSTPGGAWRPERAGHVPSVGY
ncbi:ABC transporter permease [Roseomonas sp. CCTCC AB2023176]|uniref:ABC transporter permease n=1 Tax=Roseomonas sp. CCTCC AB2023176 TaxID=3342640 RepID=UPI0035DFF831